MGTQLVHGFPLVKKTTNSVISKPTEFTCFLLIQNINESNERQISLLLRRSLETFGDMKFSS